MEEISDKMLARERSVILFRLDWTHKITTKFIVQFVK